VSTVKVKLKVRFVTIMQKYSGEKREIEIEVPPEAGAAIEYIIKQFQIPWRDNLEKSTRIFINNMPCNTFIKNGKLLETGDNIAFIPISGGG